MIFKKLLLDVSFLHSAEESRQVGKNNNKNMQKCCVFWMLRTEKHDGKQKTNKEEFFK